MKSRIFTSRWAALKGLGLLVLSAFFQGDMPDAMAPLGEEALLHRCYSHLTQTRLPANHPYLAAVRGGVKAVDLCLDLFDHASLVASGPEQGFLNHLDPESKRVLRTLNDFHRSWFANDAFNLSLASPKQTDIIDSGEAALHVTRVALTPGVPFREIVTGSDNVEALRTNGSRRNSAAPAGFVLLEAVDPSSSASRPIDTDFVQTGDLIGARPMSLNPRKHGTLTIMGSVAPPALTFPEPIPVHRSFGGGIVGSRSHILLNWERAYGQRMNGGVVLPRRWSQAVLRDLLCRHLPAIRVSDAAPYVQAQPAANTPAFRVSQNCMTCHATIDPMAAVARNLSLVFMPSHFVGSGVGSTHSSLHSAVPTLPRETGQVDADSNFWLRPPNGRLFYRSYSGELIHEPVNGFASLGDALSRTPDLYACAASRYFYFFTGVKVSLQDNGDPNNQSLSAEDLTYRNLVIDLGKSLAGHQNVKQLVHDILDSDIYRRSSLRIFESVE